jgi:hypothetical protein
LRDKPHIALVMAGTNDVTFGALFGDLEGVPARVGMLIDALVSADRNMPVLLAQITPRQSGNTDTEAFNRALPAVVERRASEAKQVLLVDM